MTLPHRKLPSRRNSCITGVTGVSVAATKSRPTPRVIAHIDAVKLDTSFRKPLGKEWRIKDGDPSQNSNAMIRDLIRDNDTILATIRDAFAVAENAADEATLDLLNARTAAHEKNTWMLRATLGEG